MYWGTPQNAATCTTVHRDLQFLRNTMENRTDWVLQDISPDPSNAMEQPSPWPSSDPGFFLLPLSCTSRVDFSISSQARHRAFSLRFPCPATPEPALDLGPLPAFKAQSMPAPPGLGPSDPHSSLPLEASFSCPSQSNNLHHRFHGLPWADSPPHRAGPGSHI